MKKTVSLALMFALTCWSAGCRAGKQEATTETTPPVDAAADEDPGWPREITNQGNTLVLYQPQIDDWKNFRELNWRMAFSLTPAGGQEAVGVAALHSNTEIDNDKKMVLLTDLKIVNTNFPSLDPQTDAKMSQLDVGSNMTETKSKTVQLWRNPNLLEARGTRLGERAAQSPG